MSFLEDDPLTPLAFSVYESKGVFALLLGSGVSRAAGIPTGWEITLDLVRRVARARGEPDQTDWVAWHREKVGSEPNYSTLLDTLAPSSGERRAILHSYIEPTDEDRAAERKTPTAAHRAIAKLVRDGHIRLIVTTNFDRLLENALREVSVEPTVVASVDALSGAEPFCHSACYILKLHGDYKDARILNTDSELATYPPRYDQLLDRILDEHGLIVCGWSGEWDEALRGAVLRAPNRRYSVFWAARGTLQDRAKELITHRRARVIPIENADAFFTDLQQRVETLEQTHRQNPVGIDLLVSTAKRLLAQPEYRIQLDDLVTHEVRRVVDRLSGPQFAAPTNWNPATFRQLVDRYEAATEALASIAGVLGRWGDGSETGLMRGIVQSLVGHAGKIRDGLNFYVQTRTYPAVLVVVAYGLGATCGERWKAAHELLGSEIYQENGDRARVVETLFGRAWKGAEDSIWNALYGSQPRRTPLSDHLAEIFSRWIGRFGGLVPESDLMFDRFEMLGSLIHLENKGKANVRSILEKDSGDWTHMPVGRVLWNRKHREQLTAEFQTAPGKEALLASGIANGDPEILDLFVENLNRISSRLR